MWTAGQDGTGSSRRLTPCRRQARAAQPLAALRVQSLLTRRLASCSYAWVRPAGGARAKAAQHLHRQQYALLRCVATLQPRALLLGYDSKLWHSASTLWLLLPAFGCAGNICRSPTAEAMFRAVVQRNGLEDKFEIDSCGTGGGNPDW